VISVVVSLVVYANLFCAELWLFSSERFVVWRVMTLVGIVVSALVLLIVLPYTWFGGGGPPWNRSFLSVYPAMF
jgi:hypothetical protein